MQREGEERAFPMSRSRLGFIGGTVSLWPAFLSCTYTKAQQCSLSRVREWERGREGEKYLFGFPFSLLRLVAPLFSLLSHPSLRVDTSCRTSIYSQDTAPVHRRAKGRRFRHADGFLIKKRPRQDTAQLRTGSTQHWGDEAVREGSHPKMR